jgi:hypothetical protein
VLPENACEHIPVRRDPSVRIRAVVSAAALRGTGTYCAGGGPDALSVSTAASNVRTSACSTGGPLSVCGFVMCESSSARAPVRRRQARRFGAADLAEESDPRRASG